MMSRGRLLARRLVLAGVVLAATPLTPGNTPPAQATPTDPQARYDTLRPPEVRLRKLHLVRPDLIPYPIAYDVYC